MPRKLYSVLIFGAFAVSVLGSCSKQGDTSLYPSALAPPTEIADWCPQDDDEDVLTSGYIWVRFSNPLNPRTVNRYTVMLGSGREHIRGAVKYDPNTYTVYYVPYEPLRPNTRYELYVIDDIRDAYGRKFIDKFEYVSFKTGNPGTLICPQNPFDPVIGRPSEEEETEQEQETENTDGDAN